MKRRVLVLVALATMAILALPARAQEEVHINIDDFETGNLSGWETGTTRDISGIPVPTEGRLPGVTSTKSYRGNYSALVGGPPLVSSGAGPFYSWMKKTVKIPADIKSIKLQYAYWPYNDNSSSIGRCYYFVEGDNTKNILVDSKIPDLEKCYILF